MHDLHTRVRVLFRFRSFACPRYNRDCLAGDSSKRPGCVRVRERAPGFPSWTLFELCAERHQRSWARLLSESTSTTAEKTRFILKLAAGQGAIHIASVPNWRLTVSDEPSVSDPLAGTARRPRFSRTGSGHRLARPGSRVPRPRREKIAFLSLTIRQLNS